MRSRPTLTYERIGATGGNTDMTSLSLTWTSDRAAGPGPLERRRMLLPDVAVRRPRYCRTISPLNSTLSLRPSISRVTFAGNDSVPAIAPLASALATACSISC